MNVEKLIDDPLARFFQSISLLYTIAFTAILRCFFTNIALPGLLHRVEEYGLPNFV